MLNECTWQGVSPLVPGTTPAADFGDVLGHFDITYALDSLFAKS
jgi:hypothetical protein